MRSMKGSALEQVSDPQKRTSGSTGLGVSSDLLQRPEELRPKRGPGGAQSPWGWGGLGPTKWADRGARVH